MDDKEWDQLLEDKGWGEMLEQLNIEAAAERRTFRRGLFRGVFLTCFIGGMILLFTANPKKEAMLRDVISRYYLNEVDQETLQEGAYAGMVDALGDPYSTYYTKQEYEDNQPNITGTYTGLGCVLQQEQETGNIVVTRCYEDTPASRGGMQSGDILYMINGERLSGKTLDEAVELIKSSDGETIKVSLLREGSGDVIELEMKTDTIETPMVTSGMLEDGIGYLAIFEFRPTTVHQYQEAFAELKEQGMERIIIDLRNNGGGAMASVTKILNTILPEGIIVYTEDKNGQRTEYMGRGKTPLDIPMVVLTNGFTASASEIFAGAVRDYGLAKLVGTRTYGKGVVQSTYDLGDGSAVKLTTANYYTPKGVNLNGNGLEPDVEVELDTTPDAEGYIRDNQLEKAIETVKTME